ncbi:MAG: HEAT repeat domain-containing protein [Planctomycetes bacterium]|nr:HEAT repeat domain-containing protein [Planctomycetota bacterium]
MKRWMAFALPGCVLVMVGGYVLFAGPGLVRPVFSRPPASGDDPAPARVESAVHPPRSRDVAVAASLTTSCGIPEFLRIGRMLTEDPELAPQVQTLLDSWSRHEAPEMRFRAEVLRPYLNGTWPSAARGHEMIKVRCALLENPPNEGATTMDLLLDAAEGDPSSEVRRSALRGLSVSLDADRVKRVLGRVAGDADAGVRMEALRFLGTARPNDRAVIETLKTVAFGANIEAKEREDALWALLRCSNRHADLLTSEERRLVEAAVGDRTE